MSIDRIVLLNVGWEDLPKSISVHGASGIERLRRPTPAVLLATRRAGPSWTPASTRR